MNKWNDFFKEQDFREINKLDNYYPPKELIFSAFYVIPQDIKVVIIGQDPYHDDGQAMGLSFSVPDNIIIPPSLKNIYKNMYEFNHIKKIPKTGNLNILKHQGVFLINTSLTVEKHKPNSHTKYWKKFSINLIKYLSTLQPMVFVLWGKNALELKQYISDKHKLVISSHPSPLGYNQKLKEYPSFKEQDHFGLINKYLLELNYKKIYWNILI